MNDCHRVVFGDSLIFDTRKMPSFCMAVGNWAQGDQKVAEKGPDLFEAATAAEVRVTPSSCDSPIV